MLKKLQFQLFLTLGFWLSAIVSGIAQTYPVTISTQITQPSPIYLSNYADATTINSPIKVQIALNDLTISNRQIRLKCYFQGQSISLMTNDFVVGARNLFLEGGVPLQLTNVDLAPYFEYQNLVGINPNQYAQALPEGIYNFSVEVYDFATNKKLSKKTSVTTIIFQNDPPFLNLPLNNASIMQQNIQNIIFSWTPRQINVSNVEYEFSLVEIWDKYTPVQNAFLHSPPLYTTTTRSTTLQYGVSEPQLLPGKKYAWRVKAKALLGAEEIGVFKNNGYSEIFAFDYETYCTAPLAITTTDISQDQAKITWSGDIDNFDYQVNYREKNANSDWYKIVTPREFATISNLKPNATYEYTVGASCEVGKYTHSTVHEFSTMAKDEIAFVGCGIKPDPADLANKNPLPELFANDVVKAGDFPIVVLHSTGSNGKFSGDGYVTLPFLEKFRTLIDAANAAGGPDIGKYSRIRITFDNIGINTDFKLISGEIIASYDPDGWNSLLDGDKLVDDIKNFLNNYKGTDEDVAKAKELHKIQEEQISLLLADESLSQEDKNKIIEAQNNAKDSWNGLENRIPCAKSANTSDKNEKGGPREYYIEEDTFDCYTAPVEKESKEIEEASGKTTCSLPSPARGCPATGGIENPMNDGDWEAVIRILKELKNAIQNKKPYTFTKIMTNLEAQISIGKNCFDPILIDYSSMTDKTSTVKEVTFTNEITKSNFGGDYWTLIFNKTLWIKIKQEIKDGKDISKVKIDVLEKWLKCDSESKEEDTEDKPATINITADILSKVFSDVDKERLEEIAKAINKYSDKFELTTPLRMNHFLAQIGAETMGLKKLSEDVCYKTKKRIKEIFGKTFYCDLFEGYDSDLSKCLRGHPSPCVPVLDKITKDLVVKDKYLCSPLLMDYTYSCRMGNGNPLSKDGSTFMAKGFIHLTGKSNYEAVSNAWNEDKENKNNKKYFHKQKEDGGHINELENNIDVAMKASMYFWQINNINKSADNDDVDKVSSIVNGIDPANGIAQRKDNLTNFKTILK